jgi:hypothetical protein
MSLDVTVTTVIDATPEAVAAIQFDPVRDPGWIGGVDQAEWASDPPLRQGSEVRRLGRFAGKPIEWLMHVEAFEPARHVGMRSIRGPFPMQVDYRLEPIEGARTRASIRIRGETAGPYRLPGPLLSFMVRRSVSGDLKRLRRLVEG